MNMSESVRALREKCRKQKKGREFARGCFQVFMRVVADAVAGMSDVNDFAVFAYGSCGGRFMVTGSDTDLVVVPRDARSVDVEAIQGRITAALDSSGERFWVVNFNSWEQDYAERLRADLPYGRFLSELRSAVFLGGNQRLFDERLRNDGVRQLLLTDTNRVGSVARADLYADWRCSQCSPGDVKSYRGGTRDVQAIYRAGLVLVEADEPYYMSQVDPQFLLERGAVQPQERAELEEALDFFLASQDVASEGNVGHKERNILDPAIVRRIAKEWSTEEQAIKNEYRLHSERVCGLLRTMQKRVAKHVRQNGAPEEKSEIEARASRDRGRLDRLIDTGGVSICTTMALRYDLPPGIRKRLLEKLAELYADPRRRMWPELRKFVAWADRMQEEGHSRPTPF